MADCPDSNTQKIEYSGLSTLSKSKILRAEIDSIDEENNCAEVTLLDVCEDVNSVDFSAIPFDYLCDGKANRTAEALLDGYKAFTSGDMVYLLFLPEADSAGNQAYIIGHVDIRETKKCQVYEYVYIVMTGYLSGYTGEVTYATIFDVGNSCTLDIDTFVNKDESSPPKPSSIPTIYTTDFNAWRNYNFTTLSTLDESIFRVRSNELNDGYDISTTSGSLNDVNESDVRRYISDNDLQESDSYAESTNHRERIGITNVTTSIYADNSYYQGLNHTGGILYTRDWHEIRSEVTHQSTVTGQGVYFEDRVSSGGTIWIHIPATCNERTSFHIYDFYDYSKSTRIVYEYQFSLSYSCPYQLPEYFESESVHHENWSDSFYSITFTGYDYTFWTILPDIRVKIFIPTDDHTVGNFTGDYGIYFLMVINHIGHAGEGNDVYAPFLDPTSSFYAYDYFPIISLTSNIGTIDDENPRTIQRHLANIDMDRSAALKTTIEELISKYHADNPGMSEVRLKVTVFCPLQFKG